MRITRDTVRLVEGDMTPMIDMTFQLIAFFMVLVNFNQTDQTEIIHLPESELVRPVEGQLAYSIVLNLTAADDPGGERVVMGGREIPVSALGPYIVREANELVQRKKKLSEATIVIRAHRSAAAGRVQEVIRTCQEARFEKFALRAKEEETP